MENIPEIFSTYDFTKLEDKIQFELDGVVEKESKNAYSAENLEFCVSCIDYITLKVTDTQHTVSEFVGDLLKKCRSTGCLRLLLSVSILNTLL